MHTRFAKGQSGNPRGRPKGTRDLSADLAEELGERIAIRENDRPIRVSKQRALVKSLTAKAIKGDNRAASLLLNLILRVLMVDGATEADAALSQDDEAIIAAFLARRTRTPDGGSSP
jgi:hypothetical protein